MCQKIHGKSIAKRKSKTMKLLGNTKIIAVKEAFKQLFCAISYTYLPVFRA